MHKYIIILLQLKSTAISYKMAYYRIIGKNKNTSEYDRTDLGANDFNYIIANYTRYVIS